MKLTVCFGDVKVVVPCGDGDFAVSELVHRAVVRYKKATGKDGDYDVKVCVLKSQRDGGILDLDDLLSDVVDDKEQVFAEFVELSHHFSSAFVEDVTNSSHRPRWPSDGRSDSPCSRAGTGYSSQQLQPDSAEDEQSSEEDKITAEPACAVVVTRKDLDKDITGRRALTVRRESEPCSTAVRTAVSSRQLQMPTPSTQDAKSEKGALVPQEDSEGSTFIRSTLCALSTPSWKSDADKPCPDQGSHVNAGIVQQQERVGVHEDPRKPAAAAVTRLLNGFARSSARQSLGSRNTLQWAAAQAKAEVRSTPAEMCQLPGGSIAQERVPSPLSGNQYGSACAKPHEPSAERTAADDQLQLEIGDCPGTATDRTKRVSTLDSPAGNEETKERGSLALLTKIENGDVATITVRSSHEPLGFHVAGYFQSGREAGLAVHHVEPGGRMERDGLLATGDIVQEVNGKSLIGVPLDKAKAMLRGALVSGDAKLLVVKCRAAAAAGNQTEVLTSALPMATMDSSAAAGASAKSSADRLHLKPPPQPPARAPSTRLSCSSQSIAATEDGAVSPSDVAGNSEGLLVDLVKGFEGLGFTISSREHLAAFNAGIPPVYIKTIMPFGAAVADGRLKCGDRLLTVNGEDVTCKTQDEIVMLLRGTKQGSTVKIGVLRQQVSAEAQLASVPCSPNSPTYENVLVKVADALADYGEIMTFDIPATGIMPGTLGVSIKGETALVADGIRDLGVFVKDVVKGGAAHLDGRVKAGDLLVSVNDIPLQGLNNAAAMSMLRRAAAESRATCKVTVARRRQPAGVESDAQQPSTSPSASPSDARASLSTGRTYDEAQVAEPTTSQQHEARCLTVAHGPAPSSAAEEGCSVKHSGVDTVHISHSTANDRGCDLSSWEDGVYQQTSGLKDESRPSSTLPNRLPLLSLNLSGTYANASPSPSSDSLPVLKSYPTALDPRSASARPVPVPRRSCCAAPNKAQCNAATSPMQQAYSPGSSADVRPSAAHGDCATEQWLAKDIDPHSTSSRVGCRAEADSLDKDIISVPAAFTNEAVEMEALEAQSTSKVDAAIQCEAEAAGASGGARGKWDQKFHRDRSTNSVGGPRRSTPRSQVSDLEKKERRKSELILSSPYPNLVVTLAGTSSFSSPLYDDVDMAGSNALRLSSEPREHDPAPGPPPTAQLQLDGEAVLSRSSVYASSSPVSSWVEQTLEHTRAQPSSLLLSSRAPPFSSPSFASLDVAAEVFCLDDESGLASRSEREKETKAFTRRRAQSMDSLVSRGSDSTPPCSRSKFSSLESLKTTERDTYNLLNESRKARHRVARMRGCNESFRAAVDHSYDAPQSYYAPGGPNLSQFDEVHDSGINPLSSSSSLSDQSADRKAAALIKSAKKDKTKASAFFGHLFRLGKSRKSMEDRPKKNTTKSLPTKQEGWTGSEWAADKPLSRDVSRVPEPSRLQRNKHQGSWLYHGSTAKSGTAMVVPTMINEYYHRLMEDQRIQMVMASASSANSAQVPNPLAQPHDHVYVNWTLPSSRTAHKVQRTASPKRKATLVVNRGDPAYSSAKVMQKSEPDLCRRQTGPVADIWLGREGYEVLLSNLTDCHSQQDQRVSNNRSAKDCNAPRYGRVSSEGHLNEKTAGAPSVRRPLPAYDEGERSLGARRRTAAANDYDDLPATSAMQGPPLAALQSKHQARPGTVIGQQRSSRSVTSLLPAESSSKSDNARPLVAPSAARSACQQRHAGLPFDYSESSSSGSSSDNYVYAKNSRAQISAAGQRIARKSAETARV